MIADGIGQKEPLRIVPYYAAHAEKDDLHTLPVLRQCGGFRSEADLGWIEDDRAAEKDRKDDAREEAKEKRLQKKKQQFGFGFVKLVKQMNVDLEISIPANREKIRNLAQAIFRDELGEIDTSTDEAKDDFFVKALLIVINQKSIQTANEQLHYWPGSDTFARNHYKDFGFTEKEVMAAAIKAKKED